MLFISPRSSNAQTGTRLLRYLIALLAMIGACCIAMAQDLVPQPAPTPDQAADIQSIINIWHAYATDVDSHNVDGVAAMGSPIGGYVDEQDMDTLAPSGCQPQPGGSRLRTTSRCRRRRCVR